MNRIIEITGRAKIKIVLHEIHKDLSEYNKNGIHWSRKYVEQNMDSAKGAPIVAQFLDSDQDMPFGHGELHVDENKNIRFEDSVVVGSIEEAVIESLEINGVNRDVLVAYGVLYTERFSNFVEWMRKTFETEGVKSSVEIGIKAPNETIIYEGGWKEKGRVPMEYQYTGHAILSIEPSDDSAILLELNNKHKEENKLSDKVVVELNEKLELKVTEINSLKDEVKTKDVQITELNSVVETKTQKLEGLTVEVNELKETVTAKETELETLTSEVNELREFKQEATNKELVAELNSSLEVYTDEEKALVKEKVETFSASPSKEGIGEIVTEINTFIAKKAIEERSKKVDAPAPVAEDIYGDILEVNAKDEEVTEEDIY